MLYLETVRFVDECHNVQQRMSISYANGKRATFAAFSEFHIWKAFMQEAALGLLAIFSHPYLL